jgi:hypothetical protein
MDRGAMKKFHIEEHLRPTQIIFLSADIVGSTAIKYANPKSGGVDWAEIIQSFYYYSNEYFLDEWEKAIEDALPETTEEDRETQKRLTFGFKPIFWKTVGDEILFRKHVSHARQIAPILIAWIKAMERVVKMLKKFGKDSESLDLKSAAWIGEFPFQNKVVFGAGSYYNSKGTDIETLMKLYADTPITTSEIDFIGPAMDIGFRISKYASPRKFILSIDVVYFLSYYKDASDSLYNNIYYDGQQYLKGVFTGLSYPIFWLDLTGRDFWNKIDDTTILHKINNRNIRIYCSDYYNHIEIYGDKPFLLKSSQPALRVVPDWYFDVQDRIQKSYQSNFLGEPDS